MKINNYQKLSKKRKMKVLNFSNLVKKELKNARKSHGPQRNLHEGYAVLLEEVDELWDEVRKKQNARNPQAVLEELVQIASSAQKTAEDVIFPKLKKKN